MEKDCKNCKYKGVCSAWLIHKEGDKK